ncbi:molybdopterin synthase [Halobacteriales archaeon QS_9_67_17]|nr:MAG: molybdopterin synthase [Halobacteriales archaeon QS_9_67_17]
MHTLGIVGPDASAAADRFVAALDGRIAVIRHLVEDGDGSRIGQTGADGDGSRLEQTGANGDSSRIEGAGAVEMDARPDGSSRARATTTYDIGDGWDAAGEADLTLDDPLDRLAPDHDYAVAIGFPDARVPQVALGGVEVPDPLMTATDAAELDVEAAVDALHDRPERKTLESLVASVKASPRADRSGAIATFTGRVRARDAEDDAPTEYLEFEMYNGVAQRTMRTIESELEEREGVLEVAMHHRQGVIPDGEDIVFVVVLAGHREEAFETVRDGINRLKDEVPIFKKEVTAEETFWVHEAERDDS